MEYKLGLASQKNLIGIDDDLAIIVQRALEVSTVDFSVVDGLRTIEEQERLVQDGKSWTLDSKHLSGDAVDIYPWVDGATSHAEEDYRRVARAMFRASQELGFVIEWGGFWKGGKVDRPHWQKV